MLQVYVTSNSEYYVRDGVCMKVVQHGIEIGDHAAVGARLVGRLRFGRIPDEAAPRCGDLAFFQKADDFIVTTEIRFVGRMAYAA